MHGEKNDRGGDEKSPPNGIRVKGTSIRQAPVFRHFDQSIMEKPMEVYYLDEWIIITLHVAGFLQPVIF